MLAIAALSVVSVNIRGASARRVPYTVDCNVIALCIWLADRSMKSVTVHCAVMDLQVVLCIQLDHFVNVRLDLLRIVTG